MSIIKFDYAEHGAIDISPTSTVLNGLFAIGAVAMTSKSIYSDKKLYNKYRTDKKGLKELVQLSGETIDHLHCFTKTLGILLVYAETAEIENEIYSIGWMIAALTDLANFVSKEETEFHNSLKYQFKNEKPKTGNFFEDIKSGLENVNHLADVISRADRVKTNDMERFLENAEDLADIARAALNKNRMLQMKKNPA